MTADLEARIAALEERQKSEREWRDNELARVRAEIDDLKRRLDELQLRVTVIDGKWKR